MTLLDETLKNAEKFFKRVAIDDEILASAIPELLFVIKELYAIRESRNKTHDYVEAWRKTKFKLTRKHTLANGDVVDVDISDPDMRGHNMFTEWLFMYLHWLYKNKTEETIGYAYALEILTQVHNSRKSNFHVVELPNADINDVLDVIETESINHIKTKNKNKQKNTSETSIRTKKFIDYLHHNNKFALLDKLHELLDGVKSKNVMITIEALNKLNILAGYPSRAVLYDSMREEFDEIGSNAGLNYFINSNNYKLTENDINTILKILKEIE